MASAKRDKGAVDIQLDRSPHIIAIRPGALGDTLLAFPALGWLRRACPSAHVTLVARGDVLPLAHSSGLADATSAYDLPQWSALFAAEPALDSPVAKLLHGCDVALAWLNDPDELVARNLAALGVARVVVAPGRPRPDSDEHLALTLAHALGEIGATPPRTLAELQSTLVPILPSTEDQVLAATVWRALDLAEEARQIIAMHPGSGGATKRWPPEHFAGLARMLRERELQPLMVEGPQDAAVTNAVLASAGFMMPIARNLSLGTLAALLQHCAAYVGNDSGVTHLAALASIRTLPLFGPSSRANWYPLGPHVFHTSGPALAMTTIEVATVASWLYAMLHI